MEPPSLDNQLKEDGVGLKALKGYFNNLASASMKEKGVIQQLVLNNTTLATSNERLVALIKKLSGDITNLEREISRLKKGGQVSASNTTLCTNFNKEGLHQPEACYELLKNKDKRPPGWRSALWRCDMGSIISNLSNSSNIILHHNANFSPTLKKSYKVAKTHKPLA